MKTHKTALYQVGNTNTYMTTDEYLEHIKDPSNPPASPIWYCNPILLWCNDYADFMCNPTNSKMTFTQKERDESVKELYCSLCQNDTKRIQEIKDILAQYEEDIAAEELLDVLNICVISHIASLTPQKTM